MSLATLSPSVSAQNEAIRAARRSYTHVQQREFARGILNGSYAFVSGIASRSFASVYGVVRRHDLTEKAKASIAAKPVSRPSAC